MSPFAPRKGPFAGNGDETTSRFLGEGAVRFREVVSSPFPVAESRPPQRRVIHTMRSQAAAPSDPASDSLLAGGPAGSGRSTTAFSAAAVTDSPLRIAPMAFAC